MTGEAAMGKYEQTQHTRNRLTAASLLYLLHAGVGAGVAIRHDLKAAFPGFYTGRPARRDFVAGPGTALSPPMVLMIWHLLAVLAAERPGRIGQWGRRMITLDGAMFAVGMLGEPITYHVLNSRRFDPPKALLVAGNIVYPLLMLMHGIHLWRAGHHR